MKHTFIAAAVMMTGGIFFAAVASASGPAVNSQCLSLQINKTTTANTGETVRCLVNDQGSYIWMIDTGVKQDPWIADQAETSACLQQGRPEEECRSPVAVAIPLKERTPGYTFIETKTNPMACVISREWVKCMGDFTAATRPAQDTYTVQATGDGAMSWLEGNIGQLTDKVTLGNRIYSAQGWIISATDNGTTFVNTDTGHGMFLRLDNVYAF